MARKQVVRPDPSRLIEGLRDTGYEFHTAMADIVDNSVAANASRVEVEIKMDLMGKIRVTVADDGCGMDDGELVNAMKYGSMSRPDPFSLGKFGLGLKTASTAFCRKLSIVSRADADTAPTKACWDLDHITKVHEWELLFPEVSDEELELFEEASDGGSGTLVVWEEVDRILKDYTNPNGKAARTSLDNEVEFFKLHAAMVYQRFLDPDDGRGRFFELYVNGEQIDPWDPFCTSEKYTEVVAESEVPVELPNGDEASFTVRAYVLPRRDEFSTPEASKLARIGNDTQGLYIYRENRLIHHGDWLRMFRSEPHGSLLRVEFSFDHRLDEAFQIDIKKSKVALNEVLYDYLKKEFLTAPRRAAASLYRKGQRDAVQKAGEEAHTVSNKAIEAQEEQVGGADIEIEDPDQSEIRVTNPKGSFVIKAPILPPIRPGECFIKPEPSLDDGLLWEPCVIDKHTAARINMGHPFYTKVYVPNLASGVVVQGMDSLLWAICHAEWTTISEGTREHTEELRYEVSRVLRQLVETLPDPDLGDDQDD